MELCKKDFLQGCTPVNEAVFEIVDLNMKNRNQLKYHSLHELSSRYIYCFWYNVSFINLTDVTSKKSTKAVVSH